MNSLSIKEKGFTEPITLKELQFASIPYNKASVLILTDSTITGKPTSDILYIGKTKKPAKKIFGGYIAGNGGKTTRKIHSLLFNDGYIEKVSVSWMLTDDPKMARKELLESFKKEHGQYPSWNVTKKPKPKPKALKIVKAVKAKSLPKKTKTPS